MTQRHEINLRGSLVWTIRAKDVHFEKKKKEREKERTRTHTHVCVDREQRNKEEGEKSDGETERIFETKTRKSLTGTCDSSINGLFATKRHERGS